MNVAIVLGAFVSIVAAVLYAPYSDYLRSVHALSAAFFFGVFLLFRRRPDPALTARVGCVGAFVGVGLVNYAYGGVSSPAIAWFILPAAASALILGWRDGWFWIAAGCVATTGFFVAGRMGLLPHSGLPADVLTVANYLYTLGFALIIGVLFTFWVNRHRTLQAELQSSVAKSARDAYLATLFADSAAAANGSLDFEHAAPVCLGLLCDANGWRAAHIWRMDQQQRLYDSTIWIDAGNAVPIFGERVVPLEICPPGLPASVAASASSPIVGSELANDPRFADDLPACVLAWPVEVDGNVDMVLEFFSDSLIELDDELRRLLGHVAAQLAQVRLRETMRDKTELMAFTDAVTGLPNRAGFEQLFAQNLKVAKRAGTRLALMFIDLDGFKRINDSLGHATGDLLLQVIGRRLVEQVRESDLTAKLSPDRRSIAARLGGDEFTLVISDFANTEAVSTVARRFLDVLAEPVELGSQVCNIGASIGIAIYPDDGKTLSDLMRIADAAMYEAKKLPGNRFQFATPALNETIKRRLWLETELHRAIRQNELEVRFSPVASALTGRLVGNEIILRWPHRDGDIAFREFFSVAENSGLISELGNWVLDKTCAALADQRWGDRQTLRLSLDISLRYLQQPHFLSVVKEVIERYDTPTGALEFEFSDTSAILGNELCRRNIRALHDMGIRIVLDRFGTGYSSLADLAELPVWRVKLDRRFIETVNLADGNRSMGRAIIAMVHSMGIETTVYGVATEAQAHWLRDLGCDALQGSWVGPLTNDPSKTPPRRTTTKLVVPNQGPLDIPA